MNDPGTHSRPQSDPADSGTEACPFCGILPQREVATSEHGIAFPDAFPLTPGHTLVVPRIHVESLFHLRWEVQADLWHLVFRVRERWASEPEVEGFTVGVNDGSAAGQTVSHAHIHVIPRRSGDVRDPRGGLRWVIPHQAPYWER